MLVPALIVVALLFAVLALARIGTARRRELARLARYWPETVLLLAGAYMFMRGGPALGFIFAAAAFLVWRLRQTPARPTLEPRQNLGDIEARAVLGVGPNATPGEIRAAFRAKMANAHPDRGGAHDHAARLVAARDRLLRR